MARIPLYTDNFEAYTAEPTDLDDQGNWRKVDDQILYVTDISDDNQVYPNGGENGYAYDGTYEDDQYGQVEFDAVTSGTYIGISLRCQADDSDDYYQCYVSTASWYVARVENGGWTQLAGGGISPNTAVGDLLIFEVVGTLLTLYINRGGEDVELGNDSGDETFSSGRVGLAGYGTSSLIRIDNWVGGNIGDPVLVMQDSLHDHLVDAPVLTQEHTLVVAESLHDHLVDNVVLKLEGYLEVQESLHDHLVDNVALIEHKTLAINDSDHAHTVDNIDLITFLYADDFEAYTEGDLDNQGPWRRVAGIIEIYDNAGDNQYAGSSGAESSYAYNDTFADDQFSQCVFEGGSGNDAGISVRNGADDSGNCLLFTFHEDTWWLGYLSSGSWGQLQSNSWTSVIGGQLQAGAVVRLEVTGQDSNIDLNVYVDDALEITLESIGSGQYNSGRAGIRTYAAPGSVYCDDWEGGNLGDAGIVLVMQDSVHDHLADAPVLTQAHVLAVNDSDHGHAADNVALTEHKTLVVAEALHDHLAENVDLEVMLIESLVSYYKCDEASGDILDAHGSNDGTNTGVGYGGTGIINDALVFDGSGNIDVGDVFRFTTTFSVSLWLEAESSWREVITKYDVNDGRGWLIELSSTVIFFLCQGSGGQTTITGTTSVYQDGLKHVVCTYDGSYLRIYVNGSEDQTPVAYSDTITYGTDPECYFGHREVAGTDFNGLMDEIGLWSRALSEAEIGELYNSGDGLAYPFTGSVTLVMQDSDHAHSADNVALTEHKTLTVADSDHSHTADTPDLTEHKTLVVAESDHAHTADAPDLIEHQTLVTQESNHAHTVDSPVLTQKHTLASQETVHDHTADNVDLETSIILVVQESNHSHTVDAPALTQKHTLAAAESLHDHTVDNITLETSKILEVQDCNHAHAADAPVLTQKHTLVVQDSNHAHTTENVDLTEHKTLVVQESLHGHIVENVDLETSITLVVADSVHAHLAEAVILSQKHTLAAQESLHAHLADNIDIVSGVGSVGIAYATLVDDTIAFELEDNFAFTIADSTVTSDLEDVAVPVLDLPDGEMDATFFENTFEIYVPAEYHDAWILATGNWNDDGIWIDEALWID